MLSAEQIKTIRDDNVCKDIEKSSRRIKEDFADAPIVVKHNIAYLSTLPSAFIFQASKTGRADAKIILAMSQILNVTPFYYTGEEDRRLALTKDMLLSFLEHNGYTELCCELRADQNTESGFSSLYSFLDGYDIDLTNRKLVQQNPVAAYWENLYGKDTATINLTLRNTYDLHEQIAELSEDDAMTLLKSLYIREKTDTSVGVTLETIKWLLLS